MHITPDPTRSSRPDSPRQLLGHSTLRVASLVRGGLLLRAELLVLRVVAIAWNSARSRLLPRMTYHPAFPAPRWTTIRGFVEDSVATVAPQCAYTTNELLVCSAPFVDWVVNVNGYPLDTEVVFHPVMVRRYLTRTDMAWTEGTRRTYRSLLMRVSELLVPDVDLPFAPTSAQSASAPYSEAQQALLRSWARGQSTASRRRSAGAVLALCTGAGLKAGEVLRVRRSDISIDFDGILVHVTDGSPRTVPMLSAWEGLLRESISGLDHNSWVFGAASRTKHGPNTLNNFVRDTDRGSEPDPLTPRMRNTWLVTHLAAGTSMRSLMQAAGLTKFDHLDTLLTFVPAASIDDYRRELRAEGTR